MSELEKDMPYLSQVLRSLGSISGGKKNKFFFILLFLVFGSVRYPTHVISAPEMRPYDKQLLRLSELLGAIHYLRELCSAKDGQRWREHMQSIIDSETSNAARKALITRSFNQGYRTYSHMYSTCTPTAQITIERFLAESADISEAMVIRAP